MSASSIERKSPMKQIVSIAVSMPAILAAGPALAQKLGVGGAAGSNATLQAAEYMLVAQVIYSDAKSRQSGGAAGILFEGLSNLGVGALGGTYASSDMGKITALALLDGFRKLTVDAQAAIPSK